MGVCGGTPGGYMSRILATLAAALVAALALTQIPAQAEPQPELQSAGHPLKIIPTFRSFRHVERPAIGRPSHRLAQPIVHRAHPMARRAIVSRAAPMSLAAAESRGIEEPVPTMIAEDRPVLRVSDTTSGLLARLPWWRADAMETIRYLDREANSGVLAAADAWLSPPPVTESHYAATGMAVQRVATDEATEYEPEGEITPTEVGESNTVDLLSVALAGPRMPSEPWLQAWLAMVAGALAAA